MGDRGRGRGGGKPSALNLDALGFGRGGEAMPEPVREPPPLFPPLEHPPLPIDQNEMYKYLIDLKRDFQIFMEDSPYYLKVNDSKKDINRYSDKYKTPSQTEADKELILNSRMPEELQPRKSKQRKSATNSKMSKAQTAINTINNLEKKEGETNAKESGDESGSEEENSNAGGDDEVEEEDDIEEDDDYIREYFDNGETFIDADDDALDDGPVY